MVNNEPYVKVAERGKPGTPSHTAVLLSKRRTRRGFFKSVLLVSMAVLSIESKNSC